MKAKCAMEPARDLGTRLRKEGCYRKASLYRKMEASDERAANDLAHLCEGGS